MFNTLNKCKLTLPNLIKSNNADYNDNCPAICMFNTPSPTKKYTPKCNENGVEGPWMNYEWYYQILTENVLKRPSYFFIRFWYLRCCSCPWNRGRQHLATPLKTCQNIEAGFLTGWLLCLSPNSDVTASETPPFPHLGCVPAVVPAKGESSA